MALATGAFAQDEQPPAADETAPTRERIVVTATRRGTDLQKSSISATVLSSEDLANKGVVGLNNLQFAAPSVTIDQNGGANVFNIRGIGRERVDVEIPSGIVIYRDGAPTLAGYFQNEPFYDMDSIEILRGPQGTLAGKNAAGGAVFIRTKTADLDGFSGFLQGGFGSFNAYEVTGAVNIPLIEDELALRVAYNHYQRDSWYNLTGPFTGNPDERKYDSGRFSFYWTPTEELEVVWKTDLVYQDFGGYVGSAYTAPLFDVHQDFPAYQVDKSMRTVLDIKYHLDNGITLNSLSGWQEVGTRFSGDINGSVVLPRSWFRAQGVFHFYSQEFTVVSPDDQTLRWIVGLFGQRQLNTIPDFVETGKTGFTFWGGNAFPAPGVQTPVDFPWASTPWRLEEDDLAVFVNFEYDFTEELMLEAGGRLSYNDREQFVDLELGLGTGGPPFIDFPGMNLGTHSITEAAGVYGDYKFALNWRPDDGDDLFYIQHSLGHISKSINIFPPNNTYGRMEVYDVEIGWKGTAFDDNMTLQFDVFAESIANYQAVFGIPGFAGGLVEARNATGRSFIWGAEFSGQATFDDLFFDFGAGYLYSELGTFAGITNPFFGDTNPMTGAPLPSDCDTTSTTVTLTGAEAPFSPNVTGNVGVGYNLHGNTGWTITPRIDYAYIGDQRATLFTCDMTHIPERDIVNASINLVSDQGWYLNLWVTNALDEEYIAGIQNDGEIVTAGAPRQYGLRVGRAF